MATGRDFTDPARSAEELAVLESIRRALAARAHAVPRRGAWVESDETHWLVVPDPDALVRTRPAVGVGFFGEAREHVDHRPIHRLERELLSRAASFPGLLAYNNVRFANGQWGN